MIINMNGAKAPETPSPILQEKTVTPETLPTVIGPDAGYDGLTQVTVNPDAQLKAENIRSGKTVFGVTGTFTGETIMTGGIDLAAARTDIYSIPDDYITGYNLTIQMPDIVISTCTVSETTTQSPSPSIKREDNYLASIYDTDAVYAFSNDKYSLSAGSYKPSGVYTYTGMNFEHTAQSYTALIQAGDRREIVGKHLKGKYGMVFVVGAKLRADGSGSSNRIYTTKNGNYTPPTVEIDCVVGDSNTSGKPVTFELPSFTFSCDGYYYSKYDLYENQMTLSVMLYPIKVTLS